MDQISTQSTIWVAGHRGLVGSALMRALHAKGYKNIIVKGREELDLTDQHQVATFYKNHKIDYVFVAAAKVGGIAYNQKCIADFLVENMRIALNVIQGAAENDVKKLLYLGSSCIYPKYAEQPIKESSLLSGPLEESNEGYALAKIAGLKLCEKYQIQYGKRFISAMPTNLYGPFDNFHPERSHVIPGMMRRFHEAKMRNDPEVVIWGSGTPKREFLFIDDLAEALVLLMEKYEERGTINIGTGADCSILELAQMMKNTVGFNGKLSLDTSRPDGTPRKVLDVSRIKKLGWSPKVALEDGLRRAYAWALENEAFSSEKYSSRR